MEFSGNTKFESFDSYPWLDYKKHKDTWLLVMGAGSNARNQHCILTNIDDGIQRAIVTEEIFNMIMSHDGLPLQIRYIFESDGQVYIEIKEVSREAEEGA
jgi:hypothetical protein